MREEENMDKVFREKLEGYATEPPSHLWDNIQGQLTEQRRLRRMVVYRWVAVAALLVLAFLGGWYLNESRDIPDSPEFAEKELTQTPGKVEVTPEKKSSLEEERPVIEELDVTGQLAALPPVSRNMEVDENSVESSSLNRSRPAFSASRLNEREGMKKLENREVDLRNAGRKLNLIHRRQAESRNTPVFPVPPRNGRDNGPFPSTPRSTRDATWKMGVNISPGYSSYSASHSSSYATNMTYGDSDGNTSLSGGFSVQYKTGKRWSVESGVYYAQNGHTAGGTPSMYGVNAETALSDRSVVKSYFNTAVDIAAEKVAMNSTAGVIEMEQLPRGAEIAANLEGTNAFSNSLLTTGEFSQVFDFVEIPLYLRYVVLDRKMNVELVGGLNAGLVVGNNAFIENEYGLQKIGKTRDIGMMNVSGTMGIGLTYSLSNHISVGFEPRFHYYLNSINRNPDVAFRPYRMGFFSGLFYEF